MTRRRSDLTRGSSPRSAGARRCSPRAPRGDRHERHRLPADDRPGRRLRRRPRPAPHAAPAPTYPPGCPDRQQPDAAAAMPATTRTVTIDDRQGRHRDQDRGPTCRPIAAGNFVALAECGYYDGVVFHRLVPGFVIQGGDGQFGREPDVDPGPSSAPAARPTRSRTSRSPATYSRGTVAMARTAEPNSVGSQFFIVLDGRRSQRSRPPTPTRSSATSRRHGRRGRDRGDAELGRPGQHRARPGRHDQGHRHQPRSPSAPHHEENPMTRAVIATEARRHRGGPVHRGRAARRPPTS